MFLQMGMYLELGPANFGHQMAFKLKVKKHVTPLKNQEINSRTMVGVSEVSDTWVTREVKGQILMSEVKCANFVVQERMIPFFACAFRDESSGVYFVDLR